ncbi:hypothetical protein B0H17DRAFT_1126234 [Mycena rosella]|uniref:Uncharacterized protein n=1 Tax=Mycena rosella TaxID=1033263 RepID=A0AAD7GUC3_MYCRO|nr:hypothetical protein B0H17DRAFT_1126234 [Mycena rosella]
MGAVVGVVGGMGLLVAVFLFLRHSLSHPSTMGTEDYHELPVRRIGPTDYSSELVQPPTSARKSLNPSDASLLMEGTSSTPILMVSSFMGEDTASPLVLMVASPPPGVSLPSNWKDPQHEPLCLLHVSSNELHSTGGFSLGPAWSKCRTTSTSRVGGVCARSGGPCSAS